MFKELEFHSDNLYQEIFNSHLFSKFDDNGEFVLKVYVELDLIRDGIRNE